MFTSFLVLTYWNRVLFGPFFLLFLPFFCNMVLYFTEHVDLQVRKSKEIPFKYNCKGIFYDSLFQDWIMCMLLCCYVKAGAHAVSFFYIVFTSFQIWKL
jgi:hypothetical protein